MWPIGPLMHEHRLIERMIALMDGQARRLRQGGAVDGAFLDAAVEFIREYADRCHHGKEEDILFRDLARRELPPGLAARMEELIQDHQYGRSLVARLVEAHQGHQQGRPEALAEIISGLEALCQFYPLHIAKEDKHFFFPCMELFDRSQKDAMLAEFWEFDRRLIHEHYAAMVEALSGRAGP